MLALLTKIIMLALFLKSLLCSRLQGLVWKLLNPILMASPPGSRQPHFPPPSEGTCSLPRSPGSQAAGRTLNPRLSDATPHSHSPSHLAGIIPGLLITHPDQLLRSQRQDLSQSLKLATVLGTSGSAHQCTQFIAKATGKVYGVFVMGNLRPRVVTCSH